MCALQPEQVEALQELAEVRALVMKRKLDQDAGSKRVRTS